MTNQPTGPLSSQTTPSPGIPPAMLTGATSATNGGADRKTTSRDHAIAEMPLEQFANAGLVLKVSSSLLDDTFLLASDNAEVVPGEEMVIYRAHELAHLRLLDVAELRTIHAYKRTLAGSVVIGRSGSTRR